MLGNADGQEEARPNFENQHVLLYTADDPEVPGERQRTAHTIVDDLIERNFFRYFFNLKTLERALCFSNARSAFSYIVLSFLVLFEIQLLDVRRKLN